MLPLIFYMLGCFVVAGVLTTFVVFSRPIHERDEMRSWRWFIFMYLLTLGGPYAYHEVLTRMISKKIAPALDETYQLAEMNGPMHYYRVTSLSKTKAKATIVGEDKEDWGGTDSPVITVNLVKEANGWKADSYKIVTCSRLNKDGMVFPPYW